MSRTAHARGHAKSERKASRSGIKVLRRPERRLVAKLKKALNYIDSRDPGPNDTLAGWAAIHDELLEEVALYDPGWEPGDEVEDES